MTEPFGTGLGAYLPVALYAAVLLTALLSIVWRPAAGLFLLILLIPLQTTRAKLIPFPFGAESIDILWFSVLLGLIFRAQKLLIPKNRMNGLLAVLAALTYLSLWRGWFYIGGDPPVLISDQRFSDWKNYMVMPIIGLLSAAVLRDKKQIRVVVILLVAALCLVNWSFLRSTSGRDFSHFSYDIRDAGVMGYAGENGFAAFVAQFTVFFITLFFFLRTKIVRMVLLLVISLSVYCLLFSFSRGGYLGCLAGITFMALYRKRKLLLGVIILLAMWQVILPRAVQERIDMTYDSNEGALDSSAGERVSLWKDAAVLIEKNPIVGSGFDTYQFMRRVGSFSDTHNYYLKVLVEMGLIGLLLLMAILVEMFRVGFQLFRSTRDAFLQGLGLGFAAMVVCTAVANLFGDRWTYLQVDGFLWVMLGCVLRGQQIAIDNHAERASGIGIETVHHPSDALVVAGWKTNSLRNTFAHEI
jgi:putative inorganic carbon (hco3(-)) transporter